MARRTVSTRSAWVMRAARAAAPACASAGSAAACSRSMRSFISAFDTAEREREAAEVLRRHRLLARAELGHRAERQRSQGLDCDEGAAPFRAGLACLHPFPGAAIDLALQPDQAVHALGPAALGGSRRRAASCARDRRRTVAAPRTDALDDIVHGGAVLDRYGNGVLDCGR